jgi:hypothetical protein
MGRRHLGCLLGAALLTTAGCGSAVGAATVPQAPQRPAAAALVAPSPTASVGKGLVDAGTRTSSGVVAPPMALVVSRSSLHLPVPTTRAVAFATDSSLIIAGGLTSSGTTGRVVRIPIDGQPASTVGRLAHPVHDAAGVQLLGSMLVLGGGASTQDAWVQRVVAGARSDVPGQLPVSRADLGAVVVGSEAIVVGGGASGRADPRVLATSDGTHFRVVARLPVPVRYAAVAAVGNTVIVVGGTSSAGDVALIQAVDLRRGTVAVVGRLPQSLSHATALVIGGVVVVAGGRHDGRVLDRLLEVDPATFSVRIAGRLPGARSDAAGVVVDGVGYLVGGEAAHPLATITTIAVS